MMVLAQVLWQSPALAPVAVALAALAAAGVLWLYPPQTRDVPGAWRWLMPALRAGAAAALTVAVVQPVVLRPRTTSREGALVLLVDNSRSMGIVDRDRSPAELVALAGGLGALPPGARREAAPGLRAQLESVRALTDQLARARGEAEYAALSGRGTAAAGARLRQVRQRLADAVDDLAAPPVASVDLAQRIAALKQIPPGPGDAAVQTIRNELDAAGRALAAAQAQADAQVFRENEQVRAICTRLGQKSRQQLLEQGLSDPQRGLLRSLPPGVPLHAFSFADSLRPLAVRNQELELDASGSRSQIGGAVREALQRMGSRPVQGIVLLSDGQQVGQEAEGIASDAAAAGVPVFGVLAAPARTLRDVSVVSIDAPSAARVGQTLHVRVELRGHGARGAVVDVRLDAGPVRQVRRITFGEDPAAVAEFEVSLMSAGPQNLVVNASPIAGEVTEANNRLERWIRVGAEPVRVVVISGVDAGRQFGSLHEALSRSQWVALRELDEEEAASLTPRAILGQDVVILCDVPVETLTTQQWEALDQLSRLRGGSVIIAAGEHAPAGYFRVPAASRLLPWGVAPRPMWRTWPGGAAEFRVAPSPAVLGSEADGWRQLPPISRYLPLPPPGVGVEALLTERSSGAAVVTETRRGLGRVYFVGTDETWRWRGQMSDMRDAFWPRLVRLAAGEPYAAVETNLWLDADEIAPEPNQAFNVSAKVRDVYGDPLDASSQVLHIFKDGQPVRNVTLWSRGEGSGRFSATVAGLEEGEYLLRLDAPEDPSSELPPDPVQLRLRVRPRYATELADVSGDARVLRRIAEASGGRFLTLDQFDTLAPRLDANRQRQSRLVEYPLWDSPYLFGFVLGCLSLEWALRKKFGLA